MEGVYSNGIFFIILCKNLQRFVGALEQNLMLLALFIKYCKIYILFLLYTLAAVIGLCNCRKFACVFRCVRGNQLHFLDFLCKDGRALLAAVNLRELQVSGSGGVFVFNVDKRPGEVPGKSRNECAETSKPPACHYHNYCYDSDVKENQSDFCQNQHAFRLFLYGKFSVVDRMRGAVDFSAVMICSHWYSYVPEHVLLFAIFISSSIA